MSLSKAKCPICGDKATTENRPFCSTRCKDVDLSRWLNGSYVIATDDQPSSAEPSNDNHSDK